VWTEDEDQEHTTQNSSLSIPKLFQHIDAWNQYGEKFSGMVIQLHGKNRTQFKILEHETSAEIWVDLKKINYWDYTSQPNQKEDDRHNGIPSGMILQSSVKDEEYEQLFRTYIIREEMNHFSYFGNG